MTAPHYEIGVVYKKNSRLYLAVTDRELISFKKGQQIEVRPYVKYDVVRHLTVTDLCSRWGITTEALDHAAKSYFTPSQQGIKPRPHGSRSLRSTEDQRWRAYRTIRLAG